MANGVVSVGEARQTPQQAFFGMKRVQEARRHC